jgi:DNA-directed RNA polymerase specialized sigma24 family protein
MCPVQHAEETRRRKHVDGEFTEEYLQRLSARDPETESHFVQYFCPLLRLRLRQRFRDDARRDDVAQETLFRVLKTVRENPASIEHPERLNSFVNSVCGNVMMEGFRGDGRYQSTPDSQMDRPDPKADIEAALLTAERCTLVRRTLVAMAPKDRLLLTEVFLQEEDKDAVCSRRGVDRQYLRVMLFRALGRFRVNLGIKR